MDCNDCSKCHAQKQEYQFNFDILDANVSKALVMNGNNELIFLTSGKQTNFGL
jgi:hypothetical protein